MRWWPGPGLWVVLLTMRQRLRGVRRVVKDCVLCERVRLMPLLMMMLGWLEI